MAKQSDLAAIGGQWLLSLLIWGGLLMVLAGSITAYPTVHAWLVPTDPESLEFSVTVGAPVTGVAVGAAFQPQARSSMAGHVQTQDLESTAPTALVSPEMEYIAAPDTLSVPAPAYPAGDASVPGPTPAAIASTEPTPAAIASTEPTSKPTSTPPPTPTPDPASWLPTRVLVPAIGLDAPVVPVRWEIREIYGQMENTWIVPNWFAAGWHVTSAPPGQPGNVVLSGHHNGYGSVFRFLVDLEPGDEITLYGGETPHRYVVVERHILEEKHQPIEVRRQNAQFIMPTDDERLTMVTCWPYTSNTHRLVIVALASEATLTPAVTTVHDRERLDAIIE